MFELNGSLTPYLKISAGVHAALIVGLAMFAGQTKSTLKPKTYRIDFIGATNQILNRDTTPQKKAPPQKKVRQPLGRPKLAPMRDPDAVRLGKPSFAAKSLRPSFISARKPRTPAPVAPVSKPSAKPVTEAPPSQAAAVEAPGAASASVSADMPDFPYPWYLQRLRASLWNRWSLTMPAGSAECGVMFTVMRGGKVVDLRVEITSGDAAFDLQALRAVKAVAPFPPLPPQFEEKFLKVHVHFKSN